MRVENEQNFKKKSSTLNKICSESSSTFVQTKNSLINHFLVQGTFQFSSQKNLKLVKEHFLGNLNEISLRKQDDSL